MRWSVAWLYGVLIGAALVAGGVMYYERERLPQAPLSEPLWSHMAAYRFVDARGQPIVPAMLRGRVVLLAFIYTRCPSVCPRLSGAMQEILAEIPTKMPVAALSISLDPERDTGMVLVDYARAYATPGHTWWYVRPESQPHAFLLAREVFRVTATTLPGQEDILHNDAFFLVGCGGRVYGPYASSDIEKAKKDLKTLIRLCEGSSSG